MLSKRGSPTLRRKCSNVLELTCSWKEKERNVPSEGEFGDGRTCSVDTEDSRYSEAEERALEAESGQGKPGQIDSSKPGQTNSTEAGQTNRTEAGQTDSSKPGQTNSTEAGQIDSSKPGQTNSTEAGQTDSSKPGQTNRTEAGQTDSSKPGQKNSTEAGQTDSSKPGQTDSSKPGQTDSSKPGQTDSSKPGQTDTSKPVKTDSTGSSGEAKQRDNDSVSPKGKIESWVRVKIPSISVGRKELGDANRINALSRKYSAVGDLKSRWQNWSSTHTVNQKLNPFSEDFDYEYSMSLRLRKGEEGYGRPKEGTKTAERARRAEQHIHGEIADMCYVIRTMNDPDPDGKTRVTFRELFDRYVRISDKVVGILLRARRHGKVAFKGEMLWQGQDDGVIITLLV